MLLDQMSSLELFWARLFFFLDTVWFNTVVSNRIILSARVILILSIPQS